MNSTKTVLKVERLESTDYNNEDPLSEFTPPRLQIFLKYIRINPDFLKEPASFPRTLNLISCDFAGSDLHKSSSEILTALECWKTRASQADHASLILPSDRELKRLLMAIETRLTHSQITLIMQHLEVVGSDSDTLWPTIGVEMRALKVPSRPEVYWRRGFEQWAEEAKSQFREDADALSALQQRYIDFLRERNELEHATPAGSGIDALELVINHCRTCLEVLKVGTRKLYLFEAHGTGTTLADKINVCFGSGIDVEERMPKYVCGGCVEKVEAAYVLKMQIDRTDEELRNLIAEYEKAAPVEETVEEHIQMEEAPDEQIQTEEAIAVVENQIQENEEVCITQDHPAELIVQENEESPRLEEAEQNLDIKPMELDIDNVELIEETEEEYVEAEQDETVIELQEQNQKYSIRIINNSEELSEATSGAKKSRNKIVPEMDNDFFQCEQCRVVLRTFELWQTHKARHESEKKFTCATCLKQFRSASTLKVHFRTHTNERPYVCDICSKSFAQNTNLAYHMKVHQNIRDYPCDRCPYRARNQNDLNLHQRSHSGARPYVCDICQCPFSTSSNLSKHIKRRHMGERNYKCEQCEKTFTTKETVQKHMVTHTRTKPYPCPECKVTYSWYNGMQKHMKSVHPGAPIPTEKTMIDKYNE